ncbi:hypothetical protein QJQ45_029082 [Haematococcus lacustris]|nr:hypothetical protein QJQ45_029082 [Haematococcus lacustris]
MTSPRDLSHFSPSQAADLLLFLLIGRQAYGLPTWSLHDADAARITRYYAAIRMRQFVCMRFRPERVVLVDEFRTSRVSSADNTPSETLLDTPPESFRWLRPVKSMAKRSQVRGLMCLTSINNITRFYDRDVSAALNIRRCAPGQEWVEIADKPLLLKWQRKLQQ